MAHASGTDQLLTVGLPVHNAMPYLPEAVESLLAQTSPDFQILVVADGCEDGSLEYLRGIRDARLRLIEQQHCGITFTLNRLLRECETTWLVRQDADDVAAPNRLATIRQAIARYPEAGMFYSDAAYHPKGSKGMYRCTRGTPDQIRSVARAGYVPAICHPSAVLHVEKTVALGGYRPGIQCEDADLWWRMALAYDIHYLPETLLFYRQNVGSLTARNLHEQALHGLYVQYLLLSQLQSRVPERLADVQGQLLALLDDKTLLAKEQLRFANMHLAGYRYHVAAMAFAKCLLASPAYLLGRLRDEYLPTRKIGNGVEPKLFHQREDAFWPQHSPAPSA